MARITDRQKYRNWETVEATNDEILAMLKADPDAKANERSQWVWCLFDNGDLALISYPQGALFEQLRDDILGRSAYMVDEWK